MDDIGRKEFIEIATDGFISAFKKSESIDYDKDESALLRAEAGIMIEEMFLSVSDEEVTSLLILSREDAVAVFENKFTKALMGDIQEGDKPIEIPSGGFRA